MAIRFGPWLPTIDPTERRAQLRALAALAATFAGTAHPLVAALRRAESDAAAAELALELLDRLPSLTRRRLLAVFARVHQPGIEQHG